MDVSLSGLTIAIMVSGGFAETEFTELQRALAKTGATLKTISTDAGLVNGWQGNSWGHYFPIDAQLGDVMAADLDALIVPGGDRSINKLKTNMNTGRILRHMLDAQKPVVMFGAAMDLLAAIERTTDEPTLLTFADRESMTVEEWTKASLAHIAAYGFYDEEADMAAAA